MYDRLSLIEKQYQEIQDKLSSGRLEVKEMTSLLKESSSIQETVETYRFFKAKSEELKELEVMIVDEQESDLIEMLQLEIDRLNEVLVKTEDKLKILLLPKDPNDDKNEGKNVRRLIFRCRDPQTPTYNMLHTHA